ncbi:MAG: 5'/3'-nucleotidase SurE [Bacteroidales bacterium]|nr:5'/3'-nucleotidase SurE [Bacteroidales bacterium]
MMKPMILVTNDDGVDAKGITLLTEIMRSFGDVVVVAPKEVMSGMGHAVTVKSPLRVNRITREDGFEKYSCNGTPADSVKLAEQVILRKKPDLLVSGINHGSNSAVNILYSGTMAAVIEGLISGIPSVGFSLTDFSSNADFTSCEKYIRTIVENVLNEGLPRGICLNVNIPAIPGNEIKGIKVCKQGNALWAEEFDERKDPHNRDYYWLTGVFRSFENGKDTDEWALANKYVSVVPVHYDMTAHHEISTLKKWKLNAQ